MSFIASCVSDSVTYRAVGSVVSVHNGSRGDGIVVMILRSDARLNRSGSNGSNIIIGSGMSRGRADERRKGRENEGVSHLEG